VGSVELRKSGWGKLSITNKEVDYNNFASVLINFHFKKILNSGKSRGRERGNLNFFQTYDFKLVGYWVQI